MMIPNEWDVQRAWNYQRDDLNNVELYIWMLGGGRMGRSDTRVIDLVHVELLM